MCDRIGCKFPCGRGSYCPDVDEGTDVATDEGADADAVGALDGSMVGTAVRLGFRESAGELGLALALGPGTWVADGSGVGVGVGLLLAGGGASGTVGVVGESWWARRNGRAARTITAQVAPAPIVARSSRRRFAPRRIDS
jgi:hypothetical protein